MQGNEFVRYTPQLKLGHSAYESLPAGRRGQQQKGQQTGHWCHKFGHFVVSNNEFKSTWQ